MLWWPGKCLRALGDTEIPLFVQYNWKNQPNGSSMTFVLKEREPELRENATAVRDMDAQRATMGTWLLTLACTRPGVGLAGHRSFTPTFRRRSCGRS